MNRFSEPVQDLSVKATGDPHREDPERPLGRL